MLKVFIAEDETKTLNSIKNIIENYCPATALVGTSQTVKDTILFLTENEVDLVLLDINFPDGTSFDILKQLKSYNFNIIFITAHEEFAIQAIKFSAADFLLKPLNPKELIAAIQQLQEKNKKDLQNKVMIETLLENLNTTEIKSKKIILRTAERLQVIEVKNIIRCESDSSYTNIFLTENRKVIVSKPLKDYDEMLCNFGFIRTHKSHLININYIASYEKSGGGYIVMKDKSNISVSVRKKDFVIETINKL